MIETYCIANILSKSCLIINRNGLEPVCKDKFFNLALAKIYFSSKNFAIFFIHNKAFLSICENPCNPWLINDKNSRILTDSIDL